MLRVFLWEKFQRPKSAGSIVTPLNRKSRLNEAPELTPDTSV